MNCLLICLGMLLSAATLFSYTTPSKQPVPMTEQSPLASKGPGRDEAAIKALLNNQIIPALKLSDRAQAKSQFQQTCASNCEYIILQKKIQPNFTRFNRLRVSFDTFWNEFLNNIDAQKAITITFPGSDTTYMNYTTTSSVQTFCYISFRYNPTSISSLTGTVYDPHRHIPTI